MTKPTPSTPTPSAMQQQPEGGQDYDLVLKGTRLMLDGLLKDLRGVGGAEYQRKAFLALRGMGKKRTGPGFTALQDEFREAGGMEALVSVIQKSSGPLREESLIAAEAVDSLVLLTKNNRKNASAALAAGALDQLVALIGQGDEAPVSINVLKGMHVLMTGDERAAAHRGVIEAGGVTALIKMLDTVMLRAQASDCNTWAREVATLLLELVRTDPSISSFLCNCGAVASTLKILSSCDEPLCLSLGLDILEEIVNSEDRGQIRDAMMAEGAVPALIRVMHVKGIGSKAALALAFMGEDRRNLPVIISALEVSDVACICHIAALAADADDLDAGCCLEFIQLLIESGSLHVLRCLVMSRCLGVCLALPPLQACILRQFSDPETLEEACMLLDNASTYGRLEGALATLELLLAGATASPAGPAPFFPACCSVMRRNGKVEAAVSVVLDEALGEEGDNEVTILLGELMRHLPAPSRAEAEVLAAEAAAPARLMHPARSPATTNPPTGHGGTQRGAGFTSLDVNTQRYDSTTFLVGGREFYALGWVMEQASGLLGRLIRQAGDPKAPVAVPTVEGLGDDRAYELFSLAVEYSYTGYAAISPDEALDLWAVAASLEMEELQAHCEDLVASVLTVEREPLAASLALSNRYRSGNRLRDLCVSHILDNLTDFNESGLLKEVLAAGREKIEEGAVHVLSDRFLVASRKRHVFRAP